MPELPEVETSRRGIAPYLVGETITKVIVRCQRLRWPIPQEVEMLSVGQTILRVERRAKYLLLVLPIGYLIIHSGMSGRLRVLLNAPPAEKHDHVDLQLANGYTLRYTDPRRFGAWLWTPSVENYLLFAKLGPEPLTEAFSGDYLYQLSRGKSVLIKPYLMDNQRVVGVGNIYASESLFAAGILPQRLAGSLTLLECQQLVLSVKQILQQAIDQGGTTLRDFAQTDGKPGYFAQKLQVYGRAGEPCYQCGREIAQQKLAQRSTFYCLQCQR